jgi:hypothetical protein
MITSVAGGSVSVSTIVFVEGVSVCVSTIVSIIVAAGCGAVPADVAAAPPSTGTTEYVPLLTKGSSHTTFRGTKGSDEDNKKSEDRAKSDEFEELRRMSMSLED